MGIMGIIMLRKGKMLDGAKWFGKVCTAVLYVVMFPLILFPQLPGSAANWDDPSLRGDSCCIPLVA